MAAISLRPHHALCLEFFRGEGYSGPFVANMLQVKQTLENQACVTVASGMDAICAACPNNLAGICQTQEKVCRYDRGVCALTGVQPGDQLSYQALRALVEEKILTPGLREQICPDCQWSALCHRE